MRSEPLRVFILQEMAYSSPASLANGAKFLDVLVSTSDTSLGTGEHGQIDIFLEINRVTLIAFAGAQANVQIKELAHAHDRRAINKPCSFQGRTEFFFGGFNRFGSYGAKEGCLDVVEKIDCSLGKRITFGAPEIPADISMNIFGFEAYCIQNRACCIAYFFADAVSG